MHIIMGLGNDVFNELKRTVIKLDDEESQSEVIKSNVSEDLKTLYSEKEHLSVRHSNNTLDKYIAENDLERCNFFHMMKKGQKKLQKKEIFKE